MRRPADSVDVTLDDDVSPDGAHVPVDRVRSSYDAVAATYARDLADEIVAKPIERGMLLAFAELVRALGPGIVGDVGCGPGHIAKHLASHGLVTHGIDISRAMIAEAREKFPAGTFEVASMFDLPVARAAWRGAVARYATLHYGPDERGRAFRELARVIQPDGYLLHGFYVSAPDQPPASVYHLGSWFGQPVDLDVHFVGVEQGAEELDRWEFEVEAALVREPMSRAELPTRRCYMLARRR
ncbi:MAG TPA: class I SAM-dependent methyltransferase [Kofleriaceae bacterium]|nr:class I SAM-dependent methyltransferase [Kofleriaceae bacterium]